MALREMKTVVKDGVAIAAFINKTDWKQADWNSMQGKWAVEGLPDAVFYTHEEFLSKFIGWLPVGEKDDKQTVQVGSAMQVKILDGYYRIVDEKCEITSAIGDKWLNYNTGEFIERGQDYLVGMCGFVIRPITAPVECVDGVIYWIQRLGDKTIRPGRYDSGCKRFLTPDGNVDLDCITACKKADVPAEIGSRNNLKHHHAEIRSRSGSRM